MHLCCSPPGRELWGKPLEPGTAAVVLLNRGGLASGVALGPRNPWFAPYAGCFDLHGGADAILAPCDDNVTASHGALSIALDLSLVPRSWLGLSALSGDKQQAGSSRVGGRGSGGTVSCNVFDILATPKVGASLGRYGGASWSAVVPPHGVRFLRLSNCSEASAVDGSNSFSP